MAPTRYDEVAYPSHPFRQTHPLRLAVPAALYGLDFAPAQTARVLEIGCGEGGNIIPLAVGYPNATFVGFDLASTAIAAGQATAQRLGLRNLDLKSLDILEAGPELGEFDYIIAHGVYSWVPAPVREALLRLVGQCLAVDGLAFISYNAMPGCHLRMLIREMVMHHLRGVEGFEARLAGARQFLVLFIENAPDNDPTALAIKSYCRSMLERDPRVLFHDELGPVYEAFYLHEFNAEATRHGLEYLAEAEGVWWREELFPSSRGKAIGRTVGSDAVALHQYHDFLVARLFRQSILHRAGPALDRRVDPRRVRRLWAMGFARPPEAPFDLTDHSAVRFTLSSGAAIALEDPALKRALHRIGQAWPASVPVAELPASDDVDEGLLQLFSAGHVDLEAGPASFTYAGGSNPLGSPLARLQLEQGLHALTSLDHTTVRFEDAASRHFLGLLDGSRSRADLVQAMLDQAGGQEEAERLVETQLDGLARLGLLVR